MPPRRHSSPVVYRRNAAGVVVRRSRVERSKHYVRYPYTNKGRRGRPRKRASKHKWKPRLKTGGVNQYIRRIGGASRALGSAVRAYQREYVRRWRQLSPGGVRPSGWLQAAASNRVATASQIPDGRLQHKKRKIQGSRPLVTGGRKAFISRFLRARQARQRATAVAAGRRTAAAQRTRPAAATRAASARRSAAAAAQRRSPYNLRRRV